VSAAIKLISFPDVEVTAGAACLLLWLIASSLFTDSNAMAATMPAWRSVAAGHRESEQYATQQHHGNQPLTGDVRAMHGRVFPTYR